MSLLLATIAAGEAIDYGHITVPRMYDYAKKVGADLKVVTQPPTGGILSDDFKANNNPSWWKLPLIDWFARQEHYSQMAFVDIDVFIPKQAGDLFEDAEGSGLHMCADMHDQRERPLWENWRKEKYPDIFLEQIPTTYFNAGVWVVDRGTALALSKSFQGKELHSRWLEQDVLQLMAYNLGVTRILNPDFNQPIPHLSKDVSNKSGFWHLCGMPQDSKLEWLQRMDKADRNGFTTL